MMIMLKKLLSKRVGLHHRSMYFSVEVVCTYINTQTHAYTHKCKNNVTRTHTHSVSKCVRACVWLKSVGSFSLPPIQVSLDGAKLTFLIS